MTVPPLAPRLPTLPEKDKLKPKIQPHQVKRCVCCGNEYPKVTDFYKAPNTVLYRNNNDRMPVCRGCVDSLYDHYKELYDEKTAVRRICMKFDLYYSDAIVEASKESGMYKNRFGAYLAKLNTKEYDTKTYDNTIAEEEDLAIQSYSDLDSQTSGADFQVTKEIMNEWGINFTATEYEFLENEYEDWLAKCVVKGKSQQSLVRELCIIKLQQNKMLLDGKIDLYQKLTDTYQKTLDRAALTPKIVESKDRESEIPLGMMIKRFEEHDPIPEPLPEWKDVDGDIRLISIYFLGHLLHMLGIKNRHSKMYEDEMNKYRVDNPELEDADDEDVFDAIMNRAMEGVDLLAEKEAEEQAVEEKNGGES